MDITQEQIEALDTLQSKQNDGRGICCVQDIVSALRRDDFDSAVAIRQWDGDKTRSYKDVEILLTDIFGCRTHGEKNCDKWPCKIDGKI